MVISLNVVDHINLALNGGFEAGMAGWDTDSGAGALTVTDETEGTDAASGHAAGFAFERPDGSDPEGAPGTVSRAIPAEIAAHLRGRQLSFLMRATCDTSGALVPFISADGGETRRYGNVNGQSWGHGWPGSQAEKEATYEDLKCEGLVLPGDTSQVVFGVEMRQPCTGRLDNASLVFGAACVEAYGCVPTELIAALVAAARATPLPEVARRNRTAEPIGSRPRSPSSAPGAEVLPDATGPEADAAREERRRAAEERTTARAAQHRESDADASEAQSRPRGEPRPTHEPTPGRSQPPSGQSRSGSGSGKD